MSEEKKEPVVKVNRDRYQTTRSAAGSKSLSCGDEVASTLEGLTIDELFKIGDSFLGEDFRERYAKLNVGMQRMNMGNRIRAKVRALDNEGKSGVDALKKAAAPYVKARNERIKAKEAEKAQKQKEREAKAKPADQPKAKKKVA